MISWQLGFQKCTKRNQLCVFGLHYFSPLNKGTIKLVNLSIPERSEKSRDSFTIQLGLTACTYSWTAACTDSSNHEWRKEVLRILDIHEWELRTGGQTEGERIFFETFQNRKVTLKYTMIGTLINCWIGVLFTIKNSYKSPKSSSMR